METPVTSVTETPAAATPALTAEAVKPVVETPAVVEEETKPIEAFKIPGVENDAVAETPEQIAHREAVAKLETEQNWINLAKVNNVEITEDTFSAYDKATRAKFESDKQAAVEALRQEKLDLELNKLPVEARAIIEGLKEGHSVQDLLAPVQQIDNLLALSNEELVAEDYRLQNVEGQPPVWTEDLIEKQIADLIENDRLDLAAAPLRTILNNNKKVVAQNQVDKFAQLQQQRAEHESKMRITESETIKNTISSMKEYMGVPITPEVVNYIQQKWAKGEYHDSFKDPKKVADFLVYQEFGDQGIKALKNREYQRGRDEIANKLHNIPPVSKTGAVVIPQAQKADGNFGALRKS